MPQSFGLVVDLMAFRTEIEVEKEEGLPVVSAIHVRTRSKHGTVVAASMLYLPVLTER